MTSPTSTPVPGPHTLIADFDHDEPDVWIGYCGGCDWYSGPCAGRGLLEDAHDAHRVAIKAARTPPAPSTPGEGTGEQRCVHCGQTPDDPGASMCQTWMAGVSW